MSGERRSSYNEAIEVARDFNWDAIRDPLEINEEYLRGQCELIADLFGRPGVELGVRKEEVRADILGRGTIRTGRGEYTWDGGAYIDTPDGVSLTFEDFLVGPVEETAENFREVVEHYEEAKEMEALHGD